jgi:hypothetical protein
MDTPSERQGTIALCSDHSSTQVLPGCPLTSLPVSIHFGAHLGSLPPACPALGLSATHAVLSVSPAGLTALAGAHP